MSMPWRLELKVGQQVAGYRIESYVARGGMAVVYRARDLTLGRPVALKLIAPELSSDERFRSRFVLESEAAASLDHPNVLPIYQAGEVDGLLYIAMRYVDGEDLGQALRRRGPLSVGDALPLITQVAGALDAAHGRGLVHRDVKPGNVLLATAIDPTEPPHVYLTDFGLTKRTMSLTGATTAGHFLGTVDYVSPEQITGAPVDARADIYSLGCVVFEVLAGAPPFERDSEAAVLYSHLAAPRPRLSDYVDNVAPAVDRALEATMAIDPDDRPDSCRAMVLELRQAFRDVPECASGHRDVRSSHPQLVDKSRSPADDPVLGDRETRSQRLARQGPASAALARRRRTRVGTLVALAALAVVVAGVLLITVRRDEPWRFSGTEAKPFALTHPPTWDFHPASDAVMYAATPRHLVGIFTDGDPRQWDLAGHVATAQPGRLVGVMLKHDMGAIPLSTPAQAVDAIRAVPAFQHATLGAPVRTRVDGSSGWRLDGTLSNPHPGRTPRRLAYRYYLVPVEGATAHVVFFALPDRMAANSGTFERVLSTIRLPGD
jgi:serine/threonine protein kinase